MPRFYTALFYYSLGNISPQYRSMLWNIQLLAIIRSPTLQKYGPDRILEPIMKDIKVLEQVHVYLLLHLPLIIFFIGRYRCHS